MFTKRKCSKTTTVATIISGYNGGRLSKRKASKRKASKRRDEVFRNRNKQE